MSERISGIVAPKKTVTGQLARAEQIGGTRNYNDLDNKPSVNTVELVGDRSFSDLGIEPISDEMIENILSQ